MLVLFVTAVLITSIVATSTPLASALTSRTSFNDNHYTALYPGGPKICGDHVCAPGEYDKMQQALAQAQMKGKPSTSTPSTTQGQNMTGQNMPQEQNMTGQNMPQGQSMPSADVCSTVKTTLTNAGISVTIIGKVMADLGCT